MGTHMRVLQESYPMNTNMTRFRWFSKILHPCALIERSLSIGRVNATVFSSSQQRGRKTEAMPWEPQDKCFTASNLLPWQLVLTCGVFPVLRFIFSSLRSEGR